MSDQIVSIDFSRAQAQLEAAIKQEIYRSTKSAKEVIEREFKGAMRYVFAVTPPMGGKRASLTVNKAGKMTGAVDFKKGKLQGEKAITKDISRAFIPIPDSQRKFQGKTKLDVTFPYLLKWYKSQRGPNKRIIGRPKRPAWKSQVERVKAAILKEQGITAAGWVAGAKRFSASVPGWVTKQESLNSGSVTIEDAVGKFGILVENPTKHPDSAEIQKKLGYAFTMQANAIARRAANHAKKI